MSTRKTKRRSGAFYRKEKERRNEEKSKQAGALEKFLQQRENPEQGLDQGSESNLMNSQPSTSTCNDISKDEIMDITNEIARLSSSSEDGDCDFPHFIHDTEISFNLDDPGTWPKV